MPRRDSLILRGTALWTVFVWFVFVKNIVGDKTRTTGFKAVHVTIAVISVALAVAIWRVASRNRRRARDEAATRV
jgi:Na+/melibiose symporter-like transporter